jgi:hypothetical protein
LKPILKITHTRAKEPASEQFASASKLGSVPSLRDSPHKP